MKIKTALLIVDLQRDFCPGGALGVKGGDEIIPVINNLFPHFECIIASKDWHPESTPHFEKWPPHCIRASEGAEFHPDLNITGIQHLFLKGTGANDDGYSAFEATNADLLTYLRQNKVEALFLAGLTTEYCIKFTALDACKFRIPTYVLRDAIKAVDQKEGDGEKAIEEMEKHGVQMVTSDQLAAVLA